MIFDDNMVNYLILWSQVCVIQCIGGQTETSVRDETTGDGGTQGPDSCHDPYFPRNIYRLRKSWERTNTNLNLYTVVPFLSQTLNLLFTSTTQVWVFSTNWKLSESRTPALYPYLYDNYEFQYYLKVYGSHTLTWNLWLQDSDLLKKEPLNYLGTTEPSDEFILGPEGDRDSWPQWRSSTLRFVVPSILGTILRPQSVNDQYNDWSDTESKQWIIYLSFYHGWSNPMVLLY